MTAAYWDHVAELPSVRDLLATVIRDVQSSRSVIVLLPPVTSCAFVIGLLDHELNDALLSVRRVDVSRFQPPKDPLEFLREVLELKSSGSTFAELLLLDECPEVILLDGIEHLSFDSRDLWMALLAEWARAVQSVPRAPYMIRSLCAVRAAKNMREVGNRNDVLLIERYWWGIPSVTELKQLHRLLGRQSAPNSAWSECIIAGLAPGETGLAEYIFDQPPISLDGAIDLIRQYGTVNEISTNPGVSRRKTIRRPELRNLAAPPESLVADWAQGHLVWSPEFGLELHPSLLTEPVETTEIRHRVWRGQISMLLPLVDKWRLFFASELVLTQGKFWYTRFEESNLPNQAHRLNQYGIDAEIPLLRRAVSSGMWRRNEEIIAAAKFLDLLNTVRNRLSHYQPVESQPLSDLLAGYQPK